MAEPPDKRVTAAFTGHRPDRFSFGYDEDAMACDRVKASLAACIQAAILEGCTDFLTGMALGADIWAAEQVLRQQRAAPYIHLHAIRPCASQSARWSADWRTRYDNILARCDTVTLLQEHYTRDCMFRRNRALVDGASRLIAVYSGSTGGTRMTMDYAKRRGIFTQVIDPDSGEIEGLSLEGMRDAAGRGGG